jgi:hypothetical protein
MAKCTSQMVATIVDNSNLERLQVTEDYIIRMEIFT